MTRSVYRWDGQSLHPAVGLDWDGYANHYTDLGDGTANPGGGPTPTPPPDPGGGGSTGSWPPALGSLLGVYQGDQPSDDGKSWLGSYPQISSSYWVKGKFNWSTSNQVARVQRGTVPLITVTSGDLGYMTGVLNGDATATAWADDFLSRLKTISEVNPAIPVLATWAHEYSVQIQSGGGITGVDNDPTGQLAGRVLDWLIVRAATKCPLVKVGLWYNAGHGSTVETGTLKAMTQKPAWVGADFYSNANHSASETLAQTWAAFSWIKNNADYKRLGSPPLIAPEFGDDTGHGDASLAAYYSNIRRDMKTAGLFGAVFFNRDSGPLGKYKMDGGTNGTMTQGIAAFRNSFAMPTP